MYVLSKNRMQIINLEQVTQIYLDLTEDELEQAHRKYVV